MTSIQRFLRVLLFLAASTLVTNDVVRLYFLFQDKYQIFNYQPQEEKNECSSFSIIEEEVKHKETAPYFSFPDILQGALEVSIEHLIKDDEVRHLAYLPVFSPPPDLS